MKVFLIPNITRPEAQQVAGAVAGVLHAAGAKLLADASNRALFEECGYPVRVLPEEDAYRECDVVVSVGGDGSMLHAAHKTIQHQKPLLGVNSGRLGFLTSVESDELDKLVRLVRQEYHVVYRSTLCARVSGVALPHNVALNDIVLFKQSPEKTISLDIYCDDILVSRFRGDGVIFATATGSTAYSMSAGGPILDAQLDGIIVTQICAHIVQTPPLVFSSKRTLRVVSRGAEGERACICRDGNNEYLMAEDEEVSICISEYKVPLIEFSDTGQLKSIDKKLKGR